MPIVKNNGNLKLGIGSKVKKAKESKERERLLYDKNKKK